MTMFIKRERYKWKNMLGIRMTYWKGGKVVACIYSARSNIWLNICLDVEYLIKNLPRWSSEIDTYCNLTAYSNKSFYWKMQEDHNMYLFQLTKYLIKLFFSRSHWKRHVIRSYCIFLPPWRFYWKRW
jgi:hypothetical protein